MEETQTKFGIGQITKATPTWAKWLFRIVYGLVIIATTALSGDPAIKDETKVRANLYLNAAGAAVFLFSKMFGVNPKDDETTTP